jgi:hypothetical protein
VNPMKFHRSEIEDRGSAKFLCVVVVVVLFEFVDNFQFCVI